MTRVAIVGYGNIGRSVHTALLQEGDLCLAGIVRREGCGSLHGVPCVGELDELEGVDVAILCKMSRQIPQLAAELLAKGIRTVDSFDVHTRIPAVRKELHAVATAHGSAAILGAGWDPGTDSVLRALLLAMAPRGLTHTNFGPGMSMGHTTAVKAMEGVADALSMTIPLGTGLHRRMVYVQLAEGADIAEVSSRIQTDDYFVRDETHVIEVADVAPLQSMAHGVHIERTGVSGEAQNQRFSYDMQVDNPALTAQVLVGCARAVMRMPHGCYTMIEVPPVHYLQGDADRWIGALV